MKNKEELITDIIMRKDKFSEILAPEIGDMSAKDFRRYGHEIIDWIADYFQNIEQLPVLSQIEPNWLKDNLPKSAPVEGEDFSEVLKDVDRLILPAVTNWNHPNFHGLFSTSTSAAGIFGENRSENNR